MSKEQVIRIITKNLLCLQFHSLDGGEGREDLVEGPEPQREFVRAQVIEPEPKEALFHSRVLEEVLGDRYGVDLALELSRLHPGFLL